MSQQLDRLYAQIADALEGADVGQAEYEAIKRKLKINGYSEFEALECLEWVVACAKWPDAMLVAPDGILEEIREQNDLEKDAQAYTDSQTRGVKMFEKKGIYHSAFVKAGPTRVMFTGDVIESKFGKEPFVPIKVEGDDTDHTYTIENDGIRATVESLPRNQWLTLHAAGSRDLATISVDEAPTLSDIKQAKPTAAPRPTPNIQPASTPILEGMKECLKAAHELDEWYGREFGEPMTENVRSLAISFAIERQRSGKQLVA